MSPAPRHAAQRARKPASPRPAAAGDSGTRLPGKLGVQGGARVALVGAPPGFEATLGALPAGARLLRGARGAADLTLWFVRSKAELARGLRAMAPRATGSGLWICRVKRTSPLAGDVGEREVRAMALARGIVDFKVRAVDGDWSAVRFNHVADAGGGRGARARAKVAAVAASRARAGGRG